ncbi:NnrS family protein, partial [Paracoccus sp. (in: a-proteobacteria)]|uniref:NnrS family protein n=1 Tax=Paracoccus sp. TaxID=267 RepID=UPI00396C4FFD
AAAGGSGMRLGLATALLLIILIGGRIIPSFTRNWLAAKGERPLPIPFNRSDGGILVLTVVTMAAFVVAPGAPGMTGPMAATGSVHLWRLSRWCGWQVRSEPLLWSLHLAYAMVTAAAGRLRGNGSATAFDDGVT